MTKLETELRQYLEEQKKMLFMGKRAAALEEDHVRYNGCRGQLVQIEETLNWLDNQPKGDPQ